MTRDKLTHTHRVHLEALLLGVLKESGVGIAIARVGLRRGLSAVGFFRGACAASVHVYG